MERNQENKIKENGAYIKKETIKQTPKDGFVPDSIMEPANMNAYGKYHKGTRKTVTYTTNDPRITRPFAYGLCLLFLIIGIISLLFKIWFFGIFFTSIAIFSFCRSKKDIDTVAKELKKQGQDVTINSKGEAKQVINEFTDELKIGFEETKKVTFTKKTFKSFLKLTIPIYCIIAIIVPLLIGIFVNIFLGIILFVLCIIIGLFYYYFVSKIFK